MKLVGLVKDHLSLFQQNFPFARYDFGCAAVNIDEFPEIMRFARSDKVLRVFKVVNGVEIPHRKTAFQPIGFVLHTSIIAENVGFVYYN